MANNPKIQLPRDAVMRVNLGHAFAEYDIVRSNPSLFVQTAAIVAAMSNDRTKCFFVRRRGTGKTAITYYAESKNQRTLTVLPQVISPLGLNFKDITVFKDTRQRPFKTLVTCFKQMILVAVLKRWEQDKVFDNANVAKAITKELKNPDAGDLDIYLLELFDSRLQTLANSDEKHWLKQIKLEKNIRTEMSSLWSEHKIGITVLIDRIDESWDGTDEAVVFLMALMHACVQLNAECKFCRPLLFLRENIFDRVREIDNEFARLDSCRVSMEWSDRALMELIERRLNLPFNSKLALGGETWDRFFEEVDGAPSFNHVFDFCQKRPRDVLTYCAFAIENAQSHKHEKVTVEDFQAARFKFSSNRLKDIGDEYSENYPNIGLVLNSFFGLGKEYTLNGLTAFIQKLISDYSITEPCKLWIFSFTSPERFAQLLYAIGFVGFATDDTLEFRSAAEAGGKPPGVSSNTRIVVHPSYAVALSLQDKIIDTLPDQWDLQQSGIIEELPGAIDLQQYISQLEDISFRLGELRVGDEFANEFEVVVGEIIRLCFFRWLANLEPRVRDVNGRVIRDWMASNIAYAGFWEAMRQRYNALNVIWECKNYEKLSSDDFQQIGYYMTNEASRLVIVVFRGPRDDKKHYFEHIKRLAHQHDGMVLLVNDQDLQTFIRQCKHGKTRDSHIRSIFDEAQRAIS